MDNKLFKSLVESINSVSYLVRQPAIKLSDKENRRHIRHSMMSYEKIEVNINPCQEQLRGFAAIVLKWYTDAVRGNEKTLDDYANEYFGYDNWPEWLQNELYYYSIDNEHSISNFEYIYWRAMMEELKTINKIHKNNIEKELSKE